MLCALGGAAGLALGRQAAGGEKPEAAKPPSPHFLTRGVVLVLSDLRTLDWPERAARAGLTTIATHIFPHEVAAFMQADEGQRFWESCRRLGIEVEHELHAMSDLLPRSLFDKEPAMFPMNDQGQRVRAYNLCVHSKAALDVVAENAVRYTKVLRSTTHRYFYWIDDGQPMCRCARCRELSDSDQALMLEHHVLQAIRGVDPRATLCHIAYARTLDPPRKIKPLPGIFLEFAPIERKYDAPLRRRDVAGFGGLAHGRLLDALDANLAWFGAQGAQALETGERQTAAVARRRLPRRPEALRRAGHPPRNDLRRLARRRLCEAIRRSPAGRLRGRTARDGASVAQAIVPKDHATPSCEQGTT
jgi:nitrite reductase/ring-hydroxylating ferredoxin subunit